MGTLSTRTELHQRLQGKITDRWLKENTFGIWAQHITG
jgi:hypothetical protein